MTMAQFKNFLKELHNLEEKTEPITVIGGKKTKAIADMTVKPPKSIRLKVQHPRGVPGNKTHARSIDIKEQKATDFQEENIDEARSKVAPKGASVKPNKQRPWLKNSGHKPRISSPPQQPRIRSSGQTTNANTPPINNINVIVPKSNKEELDDTKKKNKKGIVSKALSILGKKGSGSVSGKGFIHPKLSTVTSK
jgi:hypothetical protein